MHEARFPQTEEAEKSKVLTKMKNPCETENFERNHHKKLYLFIRIYA
jgi:hypothetical protein